MPCPGTSGSGPTPGSARSASRLPIPFPAEHLAVFPASVVGLAWWCWFHRLPELLKKSSTDIRKPINFSIAAGEICDQPVQLLDIYPTLLDLTGHDADPAHEGHSLARGHAGAVEVGALVSDGDVVTACQQTCPADAIVFGNLHDPDSHVAQLAAADRGYHVLDGLNTNPAVTYLMKVRNVAEA